MHLQHDDQVLRLVRDLAPLHLGADRLVQSSWGEWGAEGAVVGESKAR